MGAADAHSELERQLIVFSLHGERYGLPIADVREIIRYTPPRVTAAARGSIQGLINLRGRVMPVVDLSGRLGRVLEVSDTTRILVIEVSGGVLGLIVDGVDGVVQVQVARIEPIPGAHGDDALGDEIVAIDDQLVMLIDSERALGRVLPRARPRDEPPGARTRDEPPPPDLTPPADDPEPRRAPRPSGPPPARRRSAATPQMPRSRRRPGHTKESEG
ncbi:MAG TPA: chemotaxis protein CheW [Solirubrobacteraceae bacterium]|nr:chemotaxis protein CheW [Solirubrobacteraceae bacterium]